MSAMNHLSEGRQGTGAPRDSTLAQGAGEGLPWHVLASSLRLGLRLGREGRGELWGWCEGWGEMVSLCQYIVL